MQFTKRRIEAEQQALRQPRGGDEAWDPPDGGPAAHNGDGAGHGAPTADEHGASVVAGLEQARRMGHARWLPATDDDLAPVWANPDGAPPLGLLRDLDRRNA